MRKYPFPSLRTVLVPVLPRCNGQMARPVARAMAPDVVLVGLVNLLPGESLSAGAARARQVRRLLRDLVDGAQVRSRAKVPVSHTAWDDLLEVIAAERPDLLLLEAGCHPNALNVTVAEVLAHPPCDMALVRGPFPPKAARVLVPARGGPHAELALRVALSMQPQAITALHLTLDNATSSDAPFRGLERVLEQLPEVETRSQITTDPAQTILEQAGDFDLVVIGATAQPALSPVSLGPVADRVLREWPGGVIVVKTQRPMPAQPESETIGVKAISILVDKWFAENTFHADEFDDLKHLLALKEKQGYTISLALPALNEEKTVGRVIRTVKRALMTNVPLLDEIVLIDSDSTDLTRKIAQKLEVPVFIHQHLLPELGPLSGKGEALWKSLLVTKGDIVAWIDTDIVNIHPHFVYGILGPLLLNPRIQFAKGFYRRPLKVGHKTQAGGGGRVTELTARPLLNLFYPELSGVVQPLSGEYAGRRTALEQTPFFSGYGVEIGLLIDTFEKYGLEAIAQVDLLERVHHNQPLDALSKMSFAILQAVMRKLEQRYGREMLEEVNRSMKLIRYRRGDYFLEVEEIAEHERPPMTTLPEYQAWKAGGFRR